MGRFARAIRAGAGANGGAGGAAVTSRRIMSWFSRSARSGPGKCFWVRPPGFYADLARAQIAALNHQGNVE